MPLNPTLLELFFVKLFIQPSKHISVMIALSIGVSRVFVPQREADVHRSGTWWRRERPHQGNVRAALRLLIPTWENNKNKIIILLTCTAIRKWKSSSHVRRGWGGLWREPSLSWRESVESINWILLNAGFYLTIISETLWGVTCILCVALFLKVKPSRPAWIGERHEWQSDSSEDRWQVSPPEEHIRRYRLLQRHWKAGPLVSIQFNLINY